MHKVTIVFLAIAISFTIAAPSASESANLRRRPALVHEEVHDKKGQYELKYVTAEGTTVIEKGHLVPTPDGKDYVMVVEGEVSYVGDDGKTYKTVYSADFDGFKAVGDHIPVAPVAPAASVPERRA